MDTLIRSLELTSDLANQSDHVLLFTSLFTLFLVGLFVYVMTRNYRRMIREGFHPDLLEGENLQAQLNVTGVFSSSRTILTDRRVLQLRLAWLFSRRKVFAVAWVDTHSVAFKRSVAWMAIILAILLRDRLSPLAFLLLLWGLDSRAYSIVFGTPFAQMLWTRVRIFSRDRSQLSEFSHFYRRAQAMWAKMRPENSPSTIALAVGVDRETDFVVGKPVWVSVLVLMSCATLQRVLEGHVGFDSILFGPIYLAAPVVTARFSRRDGAWVALLGFIGLLTVKFPSNGLGGVFVNEGGTPHMWQYLGVLVTLLVMSEVSSAFARWGYPTLSTLAALLWVPFVALHMSTLSWNLEIFSHAFAAVGIAQLAAVIGSRWMAQTMTGEQIG